MEMVVAVDGPAGSGKGTITKLVAEKLGLVYIDTGALYRCITLYMIQNNINLNDTEQIEEMLKNIKIELKKEENLDKVYLDGEDVSIKIREKAVNELVSPVSTIGIIRKNITDLSRKIAEGKKVIMEGRDIGTNVFPNAKIKIYLDATPEERANRRLKQNEEKGINISYKEILENVKYRDYTDSHRELSPLKQAEDAIYIDSTNMTIEEVTEEIIKIIENNKGANQC